MSRILELKKTDGTPTIEVIIGHAHWGNYEIKLYDENNQSPELIGEGFSGDTIDDEHEIGDITTLNNRLLTFKVRTGSMSPSDTDRYHITILIRQKGKTVKDGIFTYSDSLSEELPVKTIADFALLKVSRLSGTKK